MTKKESVCGLRHSAVQSTFRFAGMHAVHLCSFKPLRASDTHRYVQEDDKVR